MTGWALTINPEAMMLYHPYPPFRAHIIYYSQGHVFEDGQWVNYVKFPDYQYVER